MAQKKQRIRITLDLSPEFYKRLEDLEALTGADSKAGLIRQSLQLYEYVIKRHLAGDEFKVASKNGDIESLVLLIPAS